MVGNDQIIVFWVLGFDSVLTLTVECAASIRTVTELHSGRHGRD